MRRKITSGIAATTFTLSAYTGSAQNLIKIVVGNRARLLIKTRAGSASTTRAVAFDLAGGIKWIAYYSSIQLG